MKLSGSDAVDPVGSIRDARYDVNMALAAIAFVLSNLGGNLGQRVKR